MKKVLVLILTLILILSSTVLTAFSASAGALNSTVVVDETGTKFTVNLSVENNPGFIAISTLAEYDSTVLKLVDVKNGEIFDNIFVASQTLSVNPYKIMYMEATSKTNITKNGVLATYTFEVLETAKTGKTEINFKVDESVTAKNGVAEITEHTLNLNIKDSSTTSDQIPDSNQNTTDKNQTVEILKPQGNTSSEFVSSELTPQNNISFENNDNSDDSDNTDDTVVVFIAILTILLIGSALTIIAVVLKKKSTNK